MQFMGNLLFSSEQEVNNMFENITSRLCNQGLVFLTITDANVLVKRIRSKNTEGSDGNFYFNSNYYSFYFDRLKFLDSPYGIKYGFYLEDSVGEKD